MNGVRVGTKRKGPADRPCFGGEKEVLAPRLPRPPRTILQHDTRHSEEAGAEGIRQSLRHRVCKRVVRKAVMWCTTLP